MKQVLNKKARDFKKKEDLIKTLKQEYTKMKNFGIDLNENSRMDSKIKKIGVTSMWCNFDHCGVTSTTQDQ